MLKRSSDKLVGTTTALLLSAIFVFILAYNCHRYLLMYNSSHTSPTYNDTPLSWQLAKYFVLIFLLFFLFGIQRFGPAKIKFLTLLFCIAVFILFVNILNFLLYESILTDELEYTLFFFLLVPLFFVRWNLIDYIVQKHDSIFHSAAIFFIITDFYVVANYLVNRRLPALGYEGGLVRFGGLWDDPNGFGFMCTFLFFWSYSKKKILLAVLLLLCVGLTSSISAVLIFIISLIYWSRINYARLNKRIFILICSVIMGGLVAASLFWTKIVELVQHKMESITEHTTFNLKFSLLPLVRGPLQFHETWMAAFFVNYFPVSLVVIVLFLYFLTSAFLSKKKDFLQYYLFIFILGNLFIPFFYDFPLNLIFFLFLIIHYRQRNEKSSYRLQND